MLTVYNGRTYEWEPPLAPDTAITVNGAAVADFSVFSGSTVGGVLLDVEAANPPRSVFRGGNPAQARVPKGNGQRSGRWVDMVSGIVSGLGGALTGMNPTRGDTSSGGQLVESGNPLPRLAGDHNPLALDAKDPKGRPYGADVVERANAEAIKAQEIEPTITNSMQKALEGSSAQLDGLAFRVKEPKSLAKKIRGDMEEKGLDVNGAAEGLFDSVRYTAVVDEANYEKDSQKVIDNLVAQGYKFNKSKNFWGNEDMAYKGINAQLIAPDGTPVELQFHTPASLKAKEMPQMHGIYDQQKLVPKGGPEWIAYEQQMIDFMKNEAGVVVPPGAENVKPPALD